MDYVALVVFLALHYLRPQEWYPAIEVLHPVQLAEFAAAAAIIMRGKAVRLRDLLRTPHDWLVLAYFAWTVFASPTPLSTFRDILPLIFFYFVGVLVLHSIPRLKNFLLWWGGLIVVIAALALASLAGFDPFDSLRITEGPMKGRLVLHLSLFNNPNALGHAMVPAIPILYYLLFWRKLFTKVTILILAVPLACIFLTQSKGAFLSAGVTVLGTLTFGRPKGVQIAIMSVALAFGGTLLSVLPRMNELEKSKSDSAIQGRIAAFRFGLQQMRSHTFGHGLGNFQAEFFRHGPTTPVKIRLNVNGQSKVRYVPRHYVKAPHSTYNQNGADLGYTGLFLFIGILYCSLRTLITARTASDDEELLRRALFGVVVSYATSSWMVDFCYRPTFFFFTAAVSGLHRILKGDETRDSDGAEDEQEAEIARSTPAWLRPHQGAIVNADQAAPLAPHASSSQLASATVDTPVAEESEEGHSAEVSPERGITWRRYGILDLAFTWLLTEAAIQLWKYAITSM